MIDAMAINKKFKIRNMEAVIVLFLQSNDDEISDSDFASYIIGVELMVIGINNITTNKIIDYSYKVDTCKSFMPKKGSFIKFIEDITVTESEDTVNIILPNAIKTIIPKKDIISIDGEASSSCEDNVFFCIKFINNKINVSLISYENGQPTELGFDIKVKKERLIEKCNNCIILNDVVDKDTFFALAYREEIK